MWILIKNHGKLRKYRQDTLELEVKKARAAGWTNREGSDSFVEALGRGLVMSKSLLPLYKSGKAKNLTKWKGKGKNRYNKSKPFSLNISLTCGSFKPINVITNNVTNAIVQCVNIFFINYLVLLKLNNHQQ